jgi:hypothetical protein
LVLQRATAGPRGDAEERRLRDQLRRRRHREAWAIGWKRSVQSQPTGSIANRSFPQARLGALAIELDLVHPTPA